MATGAKVESVDLAERGTTDPASGGTALVQSMTDTACDSDEGGTRSGASLPTVAVGNAPLCRAEGNGQVTRQRSGPSSSPNRLVGVVPSPFRAAGHTGRVRLASRNGALSHQPRPAVVSRKTARLPHGLRIPVLAVTRLTVTRARPPPPRRNGKSSRRAGSRSR